MSRFGLAYEYSCLLEMEGLGLMIDRNQDLDSQKDLSALRWPNVIGRQGRLGNGRARQSCALRLAYEKSFMRKSMRQEITPYWMELLWLWRSFSVIVIVN